MPIFIAGAAPWPEKEEVEPKSINELSRRGRVLSPMKFSQNVIALLIVTSSLSSTAQAAESDTINLPDIGDSSGALITPIQEQELGEAFFRNLHAQLTINQDPDIQQYIQMTGQKLVANSDTPGKPFHFFVVLDNAINAFAGPGGYIGVNSGLIINSESESELASVMAHEIAHVTQRHLYRAFEAASQLSLPTAAATIAAMLLSTQSAALGQAALLAVQAGNVQSQINFTRSNEEEADRIGMQILSQSEFDPRSMPIFFERLQQSSRYYGRNIPEFLRTHPVTSSRISDSRGRSEKYPYRQYPDSANYLLTKAKLRVLTADDTADLVNYFESRQSQGTAEQRAVGRYGMGLIYARNQQFKQAKAIFSQLNKEFPQQNQYISALARVEQETGNFSAALQIYQTALKKHPHNTAIKLEYISTLLKTGDAQQARKMLQSLNYETQQQPIVYKLLAQTYGELGQSAESHRYMAEYYYSIGDNESAITQIKLAQKTENLNFYLSAILEQRLQFFIAEEQQRKRDN